MATSVRAVVRFEPHQALGDHDAQVGAVAAHGKAGADGGHATAIGADHERSAGILGHLEERLALLQVDVAFAVGERDQDAAVAAQRDDGAIGQRHLLQATHGSAVGGLFHCRVVVPAQRQ